ncbi:hypothetical protein BH23CHL1_BH23CHL1_24920 [soil metagenome]
MHTRATTFKFHQDRVEEGVQFFNDINVQTLKGIREAYLLVDRATGEGMTITIWDSEDDMQAASTFAREAFARMSDLLDGSPSPKTYEVAVHESGVLA